MRKLCLGFFILTVMLLQPRFADAQPFAGAMATDSCETEPGTAVATPCQIDANPQVYEAINLIFSVTSTPSLGLDSNADTDSLQLVGNPGYWSQLGGGTPSKVAVISIGALATNTLGVFPFGNPAAIDFITPPQTGFTFLGSGTMADPFPGGVVTIASDFGFALHSQRLNGSMDTWYSDPSLNIDGIDHMLSYNLPQLDGKSIWIDTDGDGVGDQLVTFGQNAYLMAWEDRSAASSQFDSDYNDTIFLISRLEPNTVIPEPMSMVLLGGGLMGMVFLRRKKQYVI